MSSVSSGVGEGEGEGQREGRSVSGKAKLKGDYSQVAVLSLETFVPLHWEGFLIEGSRSKIVLNNTY